MENTGKVKVYFPEIGLLVLSKLFSGQYSPHENIVSLL